MLRRTREVAPGSLAVQAELGALPLRAGALAGVWARNTYVHLRAVDVPLALHDLHRALAPGAPIEATFFAGAQEGREVFPADDLPGRWFSPWPRHRLLAVLVGAGFDLTALDVRSGEDGTVLTRPAESRVGKECVSTCKSAWSPINT